MYRLALLFAISLFCSACSEEKETTRCSISAGDDTGGTLVCRTGDGATTTIVTQGNTENITALALVTSWTDNGPAGGKAYRSKFKAIVGGHYTTSLDLQDFARVSSLSIAVHQGNEPADFAAAVVQANNENGDVDLVSTADMLVDGSVVLLGPFDVDRFSYNYRLDLNVGPTGGGELDILAPPVVRYFKH